MIYITVRIYSLTIVLKEEFYFLKNILNMNAYLTSYFKLLCLVELDTLYMFTVQFLQDYF